MRTTGETEHAVAPSDGSGDGQPSSTDGPRVGCRVPASVPKRLASSTATAALATVVLLFGAAGCGDHRRGTDDGHGVDDRHGVARVIPLGGGDLHRRPTQPVGRRSTIHDDHRPTRSSPTGGDSGVPEDETGAADDHDDPSNGGARRIVTDVLARYDDAVTALALDPVGAMDPNGTLRALWDRTVAVGSFLHDDVLERMVAEPLVEGTRLLPGPDGVSYRHHVVDVVGTSERSIRFSWCGYSPGIRVVRDSGTVVDDHVATMGGLGRAVLRASDTSAGSWLLDELDHLDFEVLPPGTTDPCT